jgi:hypothetical protein
MRWRDLACGPWYPKEGAHFTASTTPPNTQCSFDQSMAVRWSVEGPLGNFWNSSPSGSIVDLIDEGKLKK